MTAEADQPHIGLIVEGPGDVKALPILLRQHRQKQGDYRDLLGKPIPVHGIGNALGASAAGIEGFAATAASRPGCRCLLVVFDADDDCVRTRAHGLHDRVARTIGVPFHIALAERNFEDWLFASAETLGLDGLTYRDGANGAAAIKHAVHGYTKPVWQPKLAYRVDHERARERSPSFRRLLERFDSLVELI